MAARSPLASAAGVVVILALGPLALVVAFWAIVGGAGLIGWALWRLLPFAAVVGMIIGGIALADRGGALVRAWRTARAEQAGARVRFSPAWRRAQARRRRGE